jgi:hypothetical protein
VPPPVPDTVMPFDTGKALDAETVTLPPRMPLTPGVITLNVHDIATVAVSPRSGPLKVGIGAVGTPPTSGSAQFVALASARIWFWYWVWASRLVGLVSVQALGWFAAKFAAIRVMLWRFTQPR